LSGSKLSIKINIFNMRILLVDFGLSDAQDVRFYIFIAYNFHNREIVFDVPYNGEPLNMAPFKYYYIISEVYNKPIISDIVSAALISAIFFDPPFPVELTKELSIM